MMSFCRYFLCFAVFSFIGWAYETVYYSIQQRKFVNSGFLSTCFCPIYGMGAMLDLILLGWIENPLILFFAGMVVTCSLDMIDSVSLPALHIMTCVIAFVMIADTVKTVKCMDSSKLWYVEKQAEFMDELRNGRCVGLVKKIKDTFRR